MKQMIALISITVLCLQAPGQSTLKPVDHFPKKPRENTWAYDSLHQKVGIYFDGKWEKIPAPDCKGVTRYGSFVYIATYPGLLTDTLGNILERDVDKVRGDDAVIFLYLRLAADYCLRNNGDTILEIAAYFGDYDSSYIEIPHQVQGKRAYCLPLLPDTEWNPAMYDLNSWGMIGLDGKWLIEPKFDEYFHFENGIAEVLHYGKPRKINERGEFVD